MSKARQSKRQRYRKPRADYQAGGRVKASTGRWYPFKRIVDKVKGDSDTKGGSGRDTVAPDQVDKDLKGQGMAESAEAGLWKKAYETVNVFDDKTPRGVVFLGHLTHQGKTLRKPVSLRRFRP